MENQDSLADDSLADDSLANDKTVARNPSRKSNRAPDDSSRQLASESGAASKPVSDNSGGDDGTDNRFESGLEDAKTVIRQTGESDHRNPGRGGRTPAEIASVLVGEQLDQYFLEALIGGGGMGAVFRAHDQRLDRIVALKVIPFVGNDPELQRRFRNEAQNAAKLDHPKIARVFDAGEYDDWHYIVFEYIDGTNLRDLVQDHGVLSLDDAVVFTSQVAEALDHASQRGIVHRDIKPSNILVSEDGSVKLVDMGLARSDNLDLSEDMTASGVTLGTFDYISPEQAFDPRDADLRSDLYSLGCTFYFMVTGEAPYTGGTMLQKLISHGNAPPPDPRQIRPDLPAEAVAVMHRMMAKDPQARYQNASDLLADLGELAFRFQLKRAQSNDIVAVPTGNDGLQRLQTHLPWMIAVLLIVMIGGYLELQSTASRDAFFIDGPDALNRIGVTGTKTESTPDQSSATDADTRSPEPPESNSGLSAQDALAQPDSFGPSSSRVSPNGLLTDSLAANNDNADSNETSEAAARPPKFGAQMLDTQSPLPSDIEPKVSESNGGIPAIFSTGDRNPVGEMTAEANASSGSVSPPLDPQTRPSTASAADSPTRPPPEGELPQPQVIRVVAPSLLALAMRVDQVDRDNDGALLAATLDSAVDLAMRFGVEHVELATPQVVTGPLTIPLDNMVFESTVGRTSIRMVSTDTLAIGRSEVLNIGSNRTQFKNIDFHWELAPEQVDGGAMFVINDNRLTRFQNCSFTLVNKAIHDGVTFFQIVTDPDALPDSETLPGRTLNPSKDALPLVAIQLDDAIVRGEATFIRMDYAAALQLVWNNGLIAISGRMIETSGALRRPPTVASPIQISLSNVTAEIPLGLLRMRLGPTGQFPVSIERQADQCVFLVDEGQPQFEIIGVESLATERPYLNLRGEDNAYVGSPTLSDPILYVSDLQGNTTVNTMNDLRSETLPWIDERRPSWSVRWSSVRPRSQTYHRLTPANYRQDGVIYFGFRELDLPRLP